MTRSELRVLYIATKPAYPPRDGGRLLIWNTLTELSARGHRIAYVAPDLGADTTVPKEHLESVCERVRLVPGSPPGVAGSAAQALLGRKPISIFRHTHGEVQKAVTTALQEFAPDVVHAEQIQAFYNLPANRPDVPVLLRAQNVESRLWRMVAQRRRWLAWPARDEARKMAVSEARAIRRANRTVVLTRPDAVALAGGAGPLARRITIIRPPFPSSLPNDSHTLDGDPPVVLLTGDWLPNRDSLRWFLEEIWPEIHKLNPGVRGHVFGASEVKGHPFVSFHPAPADSGRMFCAGSILVVPLRIGSGIRMKILEAWARRVPVVATATAVGGLDDLESGGYLLAETGRDFASAVLRIHDEPGLQDKLIAAGKDALSKHFDPQMIAVQLEKAYLEAIGRGPSEES